MQIKYKAISASGAEVEGVREAIDKLALARDMRKEGFTVVKAETLVEPKEGFSFDNLFKKVSLKEKILFAGNLSSMISAGLPLSRALDILARQTENKYFRSIVEQVLEAVNGGASLSKALGQYPNIFPDVFAAMVAAGEESGKLPDALVVVKDQLSKTYELQRKIKGAMIYPAVIIFVMIIIAILMMIFMVPTLTATFKDLNVQLPILTRIIIALSDFMSGHIFLVAFGLIAVVSAALYMARTKNGKDALDYIYLKVPVINQMTKQVNAAVTMRTISSLISSGVSMVDTIKITERVLQNHYYKKVMAESSEKVQKGVALSEVFKEREKLYPILVSELSLVGEETGNLSEMLLKGAVFFEEEVDQATKNLSTIIEPAIMVVIGIAVGFFVMAILAPMYSLTNSI